MPAPVPSTNPEPTTFQRLSPPAARTVLVVFVLAAAAAVAVTLSPAQSDNIDFGRKGPTDIDLYWAEVDRVAAGEGYYEAAAAELVARGYPTQSIFNWRLPLPMWLLGKLPDPRLGQAVLGLAGLAVMLLGFGYVADTAGVRQGVLTALLLTGAVMPCILGGLYVMPPLWSGMLIALSACAYAHGRRRWAVALGLAALAFRELALPYAVVCGGLAVYERRRGEALAWLAGVAVFFAGLALHGWTALGMMSAGGLEQKSSWIQFGGAPFVISTAQMNAYLLVLPQAFTALYLAGGLLGLAGWRSIDGQRIGITVALYVMAFAVVGQPFNQYWGSMYAPLLAFGAARLPASLADLWGAANWSTRAAPTVNSTS